MIRRLLFPTIALPLLAASLAAKALVPYASIEPAPINESSGIAKSRLFENVYWTHNDSGDTARIFAITRDGKAVRPSWEIEQDLPYQGIAIGESINIDWEDIATDDQGNLLIGAFGNNANMRRDLAVYVVPEPNPSETSSTRSRRRIDFYFPEQTRFPNPIAFNFDCESLFYARGKIYLLTKNRSNTQTQLYRLDATEPHVSNPATLVSSYNILSLATAADVSPDGSKLAVLTYAGCWIFVAPEGSDDYFAGQAYYKPFEAKQCEGICWDDPETLIVTNEQRDLYQLKLADIPPAK